MKKRFFSSIVILLVILIPFTQSKLLEKQTTELLDIQLININLIDNKLVFTVLNNNNQELKLRFKLDNNLIYNDIILKSYTSQLYNIDYNKQSNLEITPYTITNNNIVLYSLSTITYNLNNIKPINSASTTIATTETTSSDIITSNTRTSYIYSNGHRISSISSDGISYYHDDILSSTRLISSNDNNIMASYDYYPFGSELRSFGSITNNNKLYTSKELDNNNLYYYNARYYNSNNGRFISVDLIFDPTESGYSYVNNNPITSNDPSGNIGASVEDEGFSDLNKFYGMPSEDVASTFGYKLAGYFVGSREERPPMFGGTFKVQDIMFGPSCGIGCGVQPIRLTQEQFLTEEITLFHGTSSAFTRFKNFGPPRGNIFLSRNKKIAEAYAVEITEMSKELAEHRAPQIAEEQGLSVRFVKKQLAKGVPVIAKTSLRRLQELGLLERTLPAGVEPAEAHLFIMKTPLKKPGPTFNEVFTEVTKVSYRPNIP